MSDANDSALPANTILPLNLAAPAMWPAKDMEVWKHHMLLYCLAICFEASVHSFTWPGKVP